METAVASAVADAMVTWSAAARQWKTKMAVGGDVTDDVDDGEMDSTWIKNENAVVAVDGEGGGLVCWQRQRRETVPKNSTGIEDVNVTEFGRSNGVRMVLCTNGENEAEMWRWKVGVCCDLDGGGFHSGWCQERL